MLSRIMQMAVDKGLPNIWHLQYRILKIEEQTGLSIREHLGFDKGDEPVLKYSKSPNAENVGEFNAKG